jgi:hypothetical protein
MSAVARKFQASPAVRKAVGLLISIVAPSSAGKTVSALRLATGIRSVCGGEIDLIDTENGRALAYADRYQFNHVPFDPPYSPDDYFEAIQFSVARGAKTVIVDQTSFEHEGTGGVLEWHEREIERLLKQWSNSTRDKVQLSAWMAPKAARTHLINEIQRMNVNLIFTFRAKEKLKIIPGKPPKELGWQAISGDEWMYAMGLQFLLTPGSDGRPTWQSDLDSERALMKLPMQFRQMFNRESPAQLDEEAGRKLAEWAAGSPDPNPTACRQHELGMTDAQVLLRRYSECASQMDFDEIEKYRGSIWKKIPTADKPAVKDASDATKRRLAPTVARIALDQATVLADSLKEEGVELTLLLGKFEIGSLEELPADKYAEAKAFIDKASAE